MTVGETWRVRPHGDAFAHAHPVIFIATKIHGQEWQVQYPDGEWNVLTASYIYQNYMRDYHF